ncbi:uncharacterized protein ACJ7VT_016059 [Polymixia lowei]
MRPAVIVFLSIAVLADGQVNGVVGGNVTLHHIVSDMKRDWLVIVSRGEDVLLNVNNSTPVHERFRDRVHLNQTGYLTITNLRYSDNGSYTVQIFAGSSVDMFTTVLTVLGADPVRSTTTDPPQSPTGSTVAPWLPQQIGLRIVLPVVVLALVAVAVAVVVLLCMKNGGLKSCHWIKNDSMLCRRVRRNRPRTDLQSPDESVKLNKVTTNGGGFSREEEEDGREEEYNCESVIIC